MGFRVLLGVAIVFFLFGFSSVSAETLWVDDDPGCEGDSPCYTSIQDAVNAANESDTVIVKDGTYVENVNVNKGLTLKSENGSSNCVIQAANSDDPFIGNAGGNPQ